MPSKYKNRISWYKEYYIKNKTKYKNNQRKRLYNISEIKNI